MRDQPTVAEMLTAVREFLRDKAMPELQGRTRFHALVASNVIAIVERELSLGPDADAADKERLQAILGRDGSLEELERELCSKIRAGGIGLEDDDLVAHLWESTLQKLAIDGPKYSAYRQAMEARGDNP